MDASWRTSRSLHPMPSLPDEKTSCHDLSSRGRRKTANLRNFRKRLASNRPYRRFCWRNDVRRPQRSVARRLTQFPAAQPAGSSG